MILVGGLRCWMILLGGLRCWMIIVGLLCWFILVTCGHVVFYAAVNCVYNSVMNYLS
jgi:hypothetical protein